MCVGLQKHLIKIQYNNFKKYNHFIFYNNLKGEKGD
jgi:hypothetical protein